MAIAFLRSVSASVYGESATVASPEVEVAAGNLVVVQVRCGGTDHDSAPTITDTAGNTYVLRTYRSGSPGVTQVAYVFATDAHATNIITATWDEAVTHRHEIIVLVFSKDGGDTWSLDDADTGGAAYSDAIATANITTTGTDEVVVAFGSSTTTHTVSSAEIGAAGATEKEDITNSESWYTIYAETKTDINATATASATCWWFAEILAFKSTAAAGGNAPTGVFYGSLVGPMGGPL